MRWFLLTALGMALLCVPTLVHAGKTLVYLP